MLYDIYVYQIWFFFHQTIFQFEFEFEWLYTKLLPRGQESSGFRAKLIVLAIMSFFNSHKQAPAPCKNTLNLYQGKQSPMEGFYLNLHSNKPYIFKV